MQRQSGRRLDRYLSKLSAYNTSVIQLSRLLLIVLLSCATITAHADTLPKPLTMRGITISCHRNGPGEWDSPQMVVTLKEIQSLGANWMTFHPYARISRDGSMRFSTSVDQPSVIQPIEDAKRLGMKVMLKPHIAYWRSGFDWRGDIAFHNEDDWRTFFGHYTEWIVTQARMAQATKVDLFCIGLEYKKAEHREADWRRVIAAVREVYDGPIVYAANWDSYDDVRFWDALDYVGIQAYFPIHDGASPTEQELHAGWSKLLGRLHQDAKKLGKPIIFTEIGYNHSTHAAKEPWSDRSVGHDADEVKLRCMRIALQRLHHAEFIEGVFLWKWFPSQRTMSRNFCLQYPEMKQLIASQWLPVADGEAITRPLDQ